MKNIIISGASSGIGEACCHKLANLNYRVFAGVRNEDDAIRLKSIAPNIEPVFLDITNRSDIERLFEKINKFGILDCLFNNAGLSAAGPAELQPISKYRQQLEINFLSHVEMTQVFIPLLRKSEDPRIVFTSSAAGILAKPMMASYSASKFALEAFIDTIRVELSPWNFKVIAIEPGKIKTKIYEKSKRDFENGISLLSNDQIALYKDLFDIARYNIENADSMSSEVSVIADIFFKALTHSNPKTRYAIGGDAKLQKMLSLLPDKLRDQFIFMKLKNVLNKARNQWK